MSLIVSIHWNCIWSTPKSGFRVKLPKESNICGIYKILFWKDFSFFREVESGPSHLHSVSPDVIILHYYGQIRSVAQSCLTLRPHESQHARPPCPSPTPGVHWDSCPSIESVMPSSHLILCCPLLLLPPIPPSIRVFSNESTHYYGTFVKIRK